MMHFFAPRIIYGLLFLTIVQSSRAQMNPNDFNRSGSATILPDNCIQLTPPEITKGGAIWFKEKIDLNYDFDIKASINLGTIDADGADGIAFVLQPLSNNSGGAGGGLGYLGIDPSMAVEFDTWKNNDPDYDHIALVKNGIISHYTNPSNTLQGPVEMLPNQGNAEDGVYRKVHFTWNATTKRFQAYYNDILKIDYTGDIINTIFGGIPYVYWGFTAATGGKVNDQRVCLESFAVIKELECPKATITAPPTICEGQAITFSAGIAKTYSWTGPNNFLTSLKDTTIQVVTSLASGTYTLRTTGVNGTCNDITTFNVQVNPIPTINAGNDLYLSTGDQTPLSSTASNDVINYMWSPAAQLSCTNCANPIFTAQNTTTYTVTGTNAQGCSASDELFIKVRFCPTASVTGPTMICKDETLNLQGTNGLSYKWIGPNGFFSTNQNPSISSISMNATGEYTFIAYGESGCNDTTTYNLTVYPIPSIYAGRDTGIVGGTSVQLIPLISSDVNQVTWSPATFLSCTQCVMPTIKPTNHTTYTVQVKNAAGCTALDDINVSIICSIDQIFIPNTFTPNNDGMNDVFYPRGQHNEFVNYLRIFDRWGNLVFERKNFRVNDKSKGWDGRYKGAQLNSGVFAYTMQMSCTTGESISRKGSIMILQ